MLKYKQIPNRGGNGDLKKTDTLRRLKLRLKFTFHSQASTTFHGHCKMLKIIICTLYIYLNAGKIELLNFMTSVCRCSAIAAWDHWNCNPRPVSFYIRNPRRLSNPERLHYKLKSHSKQMTSNSKFPTVYAHCVWWVFDHRKSTSINKTLNKSGTYNFPEVKASKEGYETKTTSVGQIVCTNKMYWHTWECLTDARKFQRINSLFWRFTSTKQI